MWNQGGWYGTRTTSKQWWFFLYKDEMLRVWWILRRPCCSKFLLLLSSYGGLKFSLLHREKVSHSYALVVQYGTTSDAFLVCIIFSNKISFIHFICVYSLNESKWTKGFKVKENKSKKHKNLGGPRGFLSACSFCPGWHKTEWKVKCASTPSTSN